MSTKRILPLSIAVASIMGCVSSGTKVTQQQISAFEVGKTTEAQVIAALGPPNGTATATDGTKSDVYMHVAAHATAATYIPIVGAFAGGAKSTTDSVTFNFDAHGMLKSSSSSSGQNTVNTGLANQK